MHRKTARYRIASCENKITRGNYARREGKWLCLDIGSRLPRALVRLLDNKHSFTSSTPFISSTPFYTTSTAIMGFFASRWIEKHGAASERAALQTTLTTTTSTITAALGGSNTNTSSSEAGNTVKHKWVSLISISIARQRQRATSRATQPVGPAR